MGDTSIFDAPSGSQKIITASDAEDFENRVNDHLKNGWQITSGDHVRVSAGVSGNSAFSAVLTKKW
jgi:hypothetical protein